MDGTTARSHADNDAHHDDSADPEHSANVENPGNPADPDIPFRLTPGTLVADRYLIGESLGAGASSVVLAAVDAVAGRKVALKALRAGVDVVLRRRFLEETRILAELDHAHLLPLLDAGLDDGLPYLVMPLVDGPSLEQTPGPLAPERVRRIGAAVADALAYIHGRGILHRDITPGNILLDREDGVFLADFGIAKAWDGPSLTAENFVAGTAGYLAPEQAEGRGASSASDVYALGLVLLEALTGVREYSGTPFERAVAAAARSPHIPPALGAPWAKILRRMTDRDRAKRPTVEEVRALLNGRPEAAPITPRRPGAACVPLAARLGLAG